MSAYTEGELGAEGEPGEPGKGGGGAGGKGGKGGAGGRGAVVILSKRIWIKDTEDVLLTIVGLVVIIGIAFAILQNRNTADNLRRHADIQSEAAVDACYQRNAEAQILRNLLITFSRVQNIDLAVQEAIQTYLAQIEDTTPRLSECRQLATELEVNR